jgi:hypothetical protein
MNYLNQLIEENKLNQIGKLINKKNKSKNLFFFYYFSVTTDDDGIQKLIDEPTGKFSYLIKKNKILH